MDPRSMDHFLLTVKQSSINANVGLLIKGNRGCNEHHGQFKFLDLFSILSIQYMRYCSILVDVNYTNFVYKNIKKVAQPHVLKF